MCAITYRPCANRSYFELTMAKVSFFKYLFLLENMVVEWYVIAARENRVLEFFYWKNLFFYSPARWRCGRFFDKVIASEREKTVHLLFNSVCGRTSLIVLTP